MRHFFIPLFILSTHFATSQHTSSDSSFLAISKKNAIRSYTKTNTYNIYNGREYNEYRPIAEEHPYLFLVWTEGIISYSGKLFEDVPLLYDLSKDAIITEHSNGIEITLIKEKVNYFILNGHRYEFLNASGLASGFYEILYSGGIKIVAKREKSKRERITTHAVSIDFEEKVKYYLLLDGKFSVISSKRSILKLLVAKSPKTKKGMEEEKLDFKSKKEESFISLAKLYDQLTSPLWQRPGQ